MLSPRVSGLMARFLVVVMAVQGWPMSTEPRHLIAESAATGSFETVFGPRDFVRGTNSPDDTTWSFETTAPTVGLLLIENGGSRGTYPRVTNAVVRLNGVVVAGAADFSNAGRTVSFFDKPIQLDAHNTLQVDVNGPDQSGFTLRVLAQRSGNAPVANAGPDQGGFVGKTVQLDGSASHDVDGDALHFHWTLLTRPPGSAAALNDAKAVRPSFVIDVPGTYVAWLNVNDSVFESIDTVTISTGNTAPIADAGPDQTAPVGAVVILDGSRSQDADGNPLSYRWTLVSRPDTSAAELQNSTTVSPAMQLDASGSYVVQLIVNDGLVDSLADTVTISTQNSAPIADAGADRTVLVATEVTLDGSASSDQDGDRLTYHWSLTTRPAGSAAQLSHDTDVRPTILVDVPGTYVAQLIVNDGTVDSAADTVSVSTLNSVPVADAGSDQAVVVLTQVTLDGSASRDADGDPLTYRWTLSSRPATSTTTLVGETDVRPTVIVDVPGTYVVQLRVNDGHTDSPPDTVVISTQNSAPVADAGADQTAVIGSTVTLDGSASHDVDGDELTYRWTLTSQPAGSAAALQGESAVRPTIEIDVPGTYIAQLIVNDGTVDGAPDTIAITTLNSAPVADAGLDQTVFVGATVQLNGTASVDADGNPLTFRWALTTRPDGSVAVLVDDTTPTPRFDVDVFGTYVAQLIVNDGQADSAPDTVTISTENSRPVANAGPDQVVTTSATVLLDGSASSDADGNPLTFRWSFTARPANGTAAFSDAAAAQPTFVADLPGEYVAQLIVNDGTIDSAPDTVVIAAAAASDPPIANAGPDQTVARTATVQLDGSGSTDPEGAPLIYEWTLISRPSGSTAALSGTSTSTPTFVADVVGTYIAQLIVSDGAAESVADTVTITVETGADLQLTFVNLPTAPPVGSRITLQFELRNLGPSATTGVTVQFQFPAGYTFAGVAHPGGNVYSPVTGIWTVGSVPIGTAVQILWLSANVNPSGPYDLSATIATSDRPDPVAANNTAQASVTPNPNADLGITIATAPSGNVAFNQTVQVLYEVRNGGPSTTTGVAVQIPIPAGYTFSGIFHPAGNPYNPATGIWTIGSMGTSNSPAQLGLSLRVNTSGPMNLTATISASTQPDPNLANNVATAAAPNRPPIANAGADLEGATNVPVTFDGSGSLDPDGDPITYQWSFTLRPANSAAGLTTNLPAPSFTPDLAGPYIARLIVTDSHGVVGAPDTATATVSVGNRSPEITSTPITAATAGQLYGYLVRATDPDSSDVLTYSLPTAPDNMTIDPATGSIQWTPAESQGGPQSVRVQVQDQGGLADMQDFVVQVSSAANHAPIAVDDAFEVRVDQSLSVGSPGAIGNDTDADGNPLSATLLTQPRNGTVNFSPDGSFTYTPSVLRAGDLIELKQVNLAARVPGVTLISSGAVGTTLGTGANVGVEAAIDENHATLWLIGQPTGNLVVVFPQDVTVRELRVFGPGSPSFVKIGTAIFELLDATGTVLFNTGQVQLQGSDGSGTITVPEIARVRRVRFTPTTTITGNTNLGSSGIAELKVIGDATIQRPAPVVDPNLGRLLPTLVRASSTNGFNLPEAAIDEDTQTNWFASGFAGELIELVFPRAVTVTQIFSEAPFGRPDGFGTSLLINQCTGTFTLFDADDALLFDSGVVNTPFQLPHPHGGFITQPLTLNVPNVGGVRRVRYTVAGCTGGSFTPGFNELKVFGTADAATAAISMTRKFSVLAGREAHSTPLVANFTDDNFDSQINLNDIPDILVPVESIGNQLAGEIKLISGDDGRELLTIGGPNLVSPWAEAAVGDIDADGLPEIVAVHSDGNHLIAFEHSGEVKWISDPNAMPRFTLFSGSGTPSHLHVGGVSIANLDGAGRPEIVIGSSVFDADGRLIGDGRTLGGTTGGTGRRSALSAIADLDLDGVPEIIAGPTAYRLVNGVLTVVWRRTDRPDGYVAVANFDDDAFPEIVIVGGGNVYMLNHDSSDAQVWNLPSHGSVALPGGGDGGAPTIADLNGDGIPEIGVAGQVYYVVFNRDGRVRWQTVIRDRSSHSTGSTVFDFDSDGSVEVLYRDEKNMRLYRGDDGVLLAKIPINSVTWAEEPVVADVDNDGHADLVVVESTGQGLHVLQDSANAWARTRRIWNQHSYHVTNVNEDATIPTVESPHWLQPGLNGFRLNSFFDSVDGNEASDSFTYSASDGTLTSNTATVRIAIRTPNGAPQITSTPITDAATAVPYTAAVTAIDPDPSDILTFSLPTAPLGMTIDPVSGVIRWTPTAAQTGSHNVIVRVADLRGLFGLQSFAIVVGSAVIVPDIVAQAEAAAGTLLAAATLTVGEVTRRHTVSTPEGAVISQSPSAGALVAPQAPVSFVVSLGAPPFGTVPFIVGQPQSGAEANIAAAGLIVGTVDSRHDFTVPSGIVLSQTPAGGTTLAGGSPVNFTLSLGRSPSDLDQDGDGFTPGQGDCNDANAAIHPNAIDIPGNGIDENCNGADSVIGDDVAPTAAIASPADLAEVTMPTDITGTATDTNFLRYTLTLAAVDETTETVIGSGTAAVSSAVLGRLDPTLLENGLYRVRLVGEDVNGHTAIDERVYRVTGQMKVGKLRLSFVDVSVPVAGIPISVVRTYDSRVKTSEDFGVGWTLDVSRGRYRHNRTPGRGWVIRDLPFLGDELPCIGGSLETLSHLTEVRLSDAEWYAFALNITNGNVGITGACEGVASFQFVDGSRPGATLDILDGSGVIYLRGGPPNLLDLQGFLDGESRLFDPQRVRLTRMDGTRIDLDRRAGITRIADLNGNELSFEARGIIHSSGKSISFERDASGRVTGITDPLGNQLVYSYDERGDLAAVVDQLTNRTTFTYDGNHHLLQIVDPLGNPSARYEYDSDARLVAVIDAAGNRIDMVHDVSSRREVLTNQVGNVTTVDYDERGNVLESTNALNETTRFTYDVRDNLLSETDPLGRTRTFTYDAQDNRVTERNALGQTTHFTYNARGQEETLTDPRGGVTTKTYSATGNLQSETDPTGRVTRFTYDDRGRPLRTTNPSGHSRRYEYDAAGNEVATTDELGHRTFRHYDALGNTIVETRTRQSNGALDTLTTRFSYDALRRPIQIVDPEGSVETIAYSPAGRRVSSTDPLGRQTRWEHDARGRVTATVYADGTREEYEFDAAGRPVATIDVGGRRTTRSYDAAGRVTSMGNADGTSRSVEFDATGRPIRIVDENGRPTSVGYDPVGRPTVATDAAGATTSFSYDASGNLIAQVDTGGNSTSFAYDAAGRAVRTTFADGTQVSTDYDADGRVTARTDQAGHVTRYAYGPRGELVEVVDPLGSRTTYAYDATGNRVSMTDALGRTTRYAFDRSGRMRSTVLPLGDTEVHEYDPAGNRISTVDFNGELTLFGYDARNRLNQRTLPGSETHGFSYSPTGKLLSMTDGRGTTTYEYDQRDRPLLMRDPSGREIRYQYDAVGNRTALTTPAGTTAFTFDVANRVTAVVDSAGQRIEINYNAVGKAARIAYPGDLSTTYEYDVLQRVRQITHSRNGSTVASYAYAFGPRGERRQVVEHTGRSVSYSYDAAGRLLSEMVSLGGAANTVTYSYDAVGNRATRHAGTTTTAYVYDANDRMTTAGPVTFAHDDNGNVTSRTFAGTTTAYQYDALNRLRQVTAGTTVTSYRYDALNQRVQRLTAAGTTDFLVDAFDASGMSQVVLESDGAGQPVASYVYAGSTPLSQHRAGTTSFRLTDGQASTRLMADTSGTITDSFDYDAFGALVARDGTTEVTSRFNGQEFDEASGLYHLRAREYDPLTGRFTGRDPFAGYLSDPVTLHPYLYSQNDPINKSDPSGQYTLAEVLLVANIVLTVTTTAYDLYHGDFKGAALNVGLAVIPFGALFKALKWAGRGIRAGASGADEIVNLSPGAITETIKIADLSPGAVTEAGLDAARAIGDDVASAGAGLADTVVSTLADRAITISTQREVIEVILGQTDDLKKMYDAAKKVYVSVGSTSAADLAYGLRRIVGTPGWQVKLCALAASHYVLTGQVDSVFAGQLEIAVNLMLRGAGYRCKLRDVNPNLY